MKLPATRSAVAIPAQRAKDAMAAVAAMGAMGAMGATTAPAAPTPSSLIKVPDAARARCVACGSPKLTQIAMTLTDGTPVQFTSCRHCEHRHWTDAGGDGRVMAVDSVLTKATKRT